MPKTSPKAKGVMFDNEGRVIVTDPEVARQIAAWAAEHRAVELLVSTERVAAADGSGTAPTIPLPTPVRTQPPLSTCPNTYCPYLQSGRFKLDQVGNPGPQIPGPAVRPDAKTPRIIK